MVPLGKSPTFAESAKMGHPGQRIFVKILREVRDGYGFSLAGYVVMPEHIHLLVSEPAKGTLSTTMQVLFQTAIGIGAD